MRAQAALEFLTTYGWMMLIAILVAGALAYFGVFSSDKSLPQQCVLNLEVGCERFSVKANGTVNAGIVNKLGEPVEIVAFSCKFDDDTNWVKTVYNVPLPVWQQGKQFDTSCDGNDLVSGSQQKIDIRVEYRKLGGGFTKVVDGQIVAMVV
jgi:hypothetical protein